MSNAKRKDADDWIDFLVEADPLQHFETRGIGFGHQLSITPETLWEAIDILKGAFGADWLATQAREKKKVDLVPIQSNQFGELIAVAGPNQICEACEIALYLKTLSRVRGLNQVIKNIRNPTDYDTSLMQLAYAYRFSRIGAKCIELEPPVANGRAGDIAFRFGDANYVAECYFTRTHPLSDGVEPELRPILKELMNTLSCREDLQHSVLMIRPKRAIHASERKRILACARKLADAIGSAPDAFFEDELISLGIRRASTDEMELFTPSQDDANLPEYGRGTCACLLVQRQRADDTKAWVQEGQPLPNAPTRNAVLIWSATNKRELLTPQQWVNEMARKIGDKLPQTKREDNARRLMIVAVDMARSREENVKNAMYALGERLEANNKNFAGVILVNRVTWSNYRKGFVGYMLAGNRTHSLPPSAIKELQHIEEHGDILTA